MQLRPALILGIVTGLLLLNSGLAQVGPETVAAKTVSTGAWGGEHIQMVVDGGGADVEFDCARGRILEPLKLDSNGRFRAKGTYKADSPAPAGAGDNSPANATYSGKVEGSKLHLEVSISGVDGIKSFDLVYGQPGTLAKCA